ncbi:MAG: MFS transporter [Bacteroidota bacterium]|jgi:MFS family permease
METAKILPNSSNYPKEFWIMCVGALSFFLSFNIVLPELATELRHRGGGAYVSWIIPLFSFSALIARPFSGWLADNVGRKVVMIGGCIFCLIAGWFYPMVGSAFSFLWLRVFHGFSTGFTPTGFTAFTADIVPESHRGRAMGWQGMFNNIGTTLGYALGAKIAFHLGSNWLFYFSSGFAAIAMIMFQLLPETKPYRTERKKFEFKFSALFYWPAWKPSLLMGLVCISLGTLLTVMPDFTQMLGYKDKGFYLSIYIATSLFFRLISGRVSDKLGRAWSTAIGTFFQIISMALLVGIASKYILSIEIAFVTSALCYGLGQGFNAPSLFAWGTDTAGDLHRGKAMAMIFIFLELGIIAGGLIAGHYAVVPIVPAGISEESIVGAYWNYSAIFGVNLISFLIAFVFSAYQIIATKKREF